MAEGKPMRAPEGYDRGDRHSYTPHTWSVGCDSDPTCKSHSVQPTTVRYHTDGKACDGTCAVDWRWHTAATPLPGEVDGFEYSKKWNPGTKWTLPDGGTKQWPHADAVLDEPTPLKALDRDQPNPSPRASALNEARDLITGDRNNQYGPPTQDFQRTADLLNALGYARVDAASEAHDILASDVAIIIAQVKVSRLMHSRTKRDSWVDLAGYAGCGYECAVEEAKTDE